MCQKCIKRNKNHPWKGHFGFVRRVAHYDVSPSPRNAMGFYSPAFVNSTSHIDQHFLKTLVYEGADRPLFIRPLETAIEAHIERVRKARTNRKFYNRKREKAKKDW